jgi:preprotein translocase subunit SecD
MRRRLLVPLISVLVIAFGGLTANLIAGNSPALGLDLQGGVSVTLQPVGEYEANALDVAVEIIRQRVDSLGVAEPEIIRQGGTVVVNLPGVKDQQSALDLVGRAGELTLRPVLQMGTVSTTTTVAGATSTTVDAVTSTSVEQQTTTTAADVATGPGSARRAATTTVPPTDSNAPVASDTTAPAAADSAVPATTSAQPQLAEGQEILADKDGSFVYLVGPVAATGEVFENDASAEIQNGSWVVVVTLRSGAVGEDQWNAVAAQCFNKAETCPSQQLAIVLDGEVISAPVVQEPTFTGGSVQISGDFTESEARQLAKILEFGAVPVKFDAPTAQAVSATLGTDSLRAAVVSGAVGVLLVLLYLFLYYRRIALVVLLGLTVSGSLQWSVISWLSRSNGLALTLAGTAGIILSVGVTVDSYVVFFEKLKDSLRSGRRLKNSAQREFTAAWRTILVADTVSLIGAAVLWWLTVGAVRGFAFFLGLSTLIDMVIAYFYTRPMVLLLARTRFLNSASVLGVKRVESDSVAGVA